MPSHLELFEENGKQTDEAIESPKAQAPGLQITRQSSRAKNDGTTMLKKATARKATTIPKGMLPNSSIPSHIPFATIEIITRACGISLGQVESTRLANISMIQAKEEALAALLKTKQKIQLSSAKNLEIGDVQDGDTTDFRVNLQTSNPVLGAAMQSNLSPSGQG